MFARALYSARDITLLDDPFAAVDMVTGDVMFRQGVKGVLSRSTRIVTLNSHMHFLHDVDLIVVMETTTDDSTDVLHLRVLRVLTFANRFVVNRIGI